MSLTSKINHHYVPNERIRQKFMMTTTWGKSRQGKEDKGEKRKKSISLD